MPQTGIEATVFELLANNALDYIITYFTQLIIILHFLHSSCKEVFFQFINL